MYFLSWATCCLGSNRDEDDTMDTGHLKEDNSTLSNPYRRTSCFWTFMEHSQVQLEPHSPFFPPGHFESSLLDAHESPKSPLVTHTAAAQPPHRTTPFRLPLPTCATPFCQQRPTVATTPPTELLTSHVESDDKTTSSLTHERLGGCTPNPKALRENNDNILGDPTVQHGALRRKETSRCSRHTPSSSTAHQAKNTAQALQHETPSSPSQSIPLPPSPVAIRLQCFSMSKPSSTAPHPTDPSLGQYPPSSHPARRTNECHRHARQVESYRFATVPSPLQPFTMSLSLGNVVQYSRSEECRPIRRHMMPSRGPHSDCEDIARRGQCSSRGDRPLQECHVSLDDDGVQLSAVFENGGTRDDRLQSRHPYQTYHHHFLRRRHAYQDSRPNNYYHHPDLRQQQQQQQAHKRHRGYQHQPHFLIRLLQESNDDNDNEFFDNDEDDDDDDDDDDDVIFPSAAAAAGAAGVLSGGTTGTFPDWHCASGVGSRRDAKSDCGSQWARKIDIYSKSRLLHRLETSPRGAEDVLSMGTTDSRETCEGSDFYAATAAVTAAGPARHVYTPSHPTSIFLPRRLHSSGSLWAFSGTSVTRKIVGNIISP